MAETGASDSSSPETDRDFDPTAEMLIHDYDDEHTLEEEEALSGDSCSNELDDLQKEGDMPLEQLVAMYRYGADMDTRSSSEEEILSNQDLTLDKDEIARDLLKNSDDDDDKETSVHDLLQSVSSSQTARLLRSNSQPGSEGSDDSDEGDFEYKPAEHVDDWKKTIQVGHDFQTVVPIGLCKYGDAPAYENEDRLLWDPSKLEDDVVTKYLDAVHKLRLQNATGVHTVPTGAHIRDDEKALYLLLQCGHNVEEALRRIKMQAVSTTDPMSLWSEEECSNFEKGLRTYGKNFYLIQQNKVKTRSVGELVQFYYLWKKTPRHDVFANKNRLEKRKYALHPGITDFMDKLLDDQKSPVPAPVRERSASPVTSLIYGDPKRNHLKPPDSADTPSPHPPPSEPRHPQPSEPRHPQPSEPRNFDLSAASTTVVTVRPQLKRRRSSSPQSATPVSGGINGSCEDITTKRGTTKKVKADSDNSSHYERKESYSDTNHIESVSLVSVCTTSGINSLTQSEKHHVLDSSGVNLLNSDIVQSVKQAV